MTGRRSLENFRFLNKNMKKPIIERRREGLFKKAKELSVLCDVKVAIVIFSPDRMDPFVWPSQAVATQMFDRFMNLPPQEQVRKLMTHERYLTDRVHEIMEKIRKKEEEIERKEMNILMNEVANGRSMKELNATQLKGLNKLAEEKIKELQKRKKYLLHEKSGGARRHVHSPFHGLGCAGGGDGSYYASQPLLAPLFADDDNKVTLQAKDSGGCKARSWWKTDAVVPPPAMEEFIPKDPAWLFPPTSSTLSSNGGLKEDPDREPNGTITTSAIQSPSNSGHQLPPFNQSWPFNFF